MKDKTCIINTSMLLAKNVYKILNLKPIYFYVKIVQKKYQSEIFSEIKCLIGKNQTHPAIKAIPTEI
jgi:hypothetical protein